MVRGPIPALHDFNIEGGEPGTPYPGVVLDASGNIYGTANGGRMRTVGLGAVFEIDPIRHGNSRPSEEPPTLDGKASPKGRNILAHRFNGG